MSKNDVVCKKCGTSWNMPKKLKAVFDETKSSRGKGDDELLSLCPKCRPQAFAERTIGKDLKKDGEGLAPCPEAR